MLLSEGDNGHCPDQDRIISIVIVWEKLKLHHFCILLKVCNITALWWWYFTDDENFSRLHCQMSKLNGYPGNSIVSVQCLCSGHTHINGKYLFENIVIRAATNCILLHVAATAAHPPHHPPACLPTFHSTPCWRCYLPYFADFWHYFWTCTLVAFHNFFRSDYIGNQTCAWTNESWPATLNVLFSQIR